MGKEEILKRSRAEKEDEGETYAADRGRRAGVMAFCLVFIAIVAFNLITGQNSYAPFAMFWAYIAAEGWGKYRVSGAKVHLWTVIFGGVGAVCWLGCHILTVIRAGM